MEPKRIPHFRPLASGAVQQTIGLDDVTTFDPRTWAAYLHGSERVRACQIPGPFQVGGSLCRDGWLVVDSRGLKAVGSETFRQEYVLDRSLLDEAA